MQAKMIWWNEFNEKQTETVEVQFVNEYGEPADNTIYIVYDGKVFYYNMSKDLISFRLDDGFTPKKRRTARKSNVFYRLTESIYSETEKAYSIVTGSNGCVSRSNLRLFLEWIPKSQTKVVDGNIYVTSFIAHNIPQFVNMNDSIN